MAKEPQEQSSSSPSNSLSRQDDDDDDDNDDEMVRLLYDTAIDELLHSTTHQSTTKEAILLSSKRRTCTIQDMRYYWSKITNTTTSYDDDDETGSNSNNNSRCGQLFPPMIHVTGTKGKGSTSCMCDVVLRKAFGLQTGLFTSPHLLDIRERIRLNGQPISKQVFGRVYWKLRNRLEGRKGQQQQQQQREAQEQQEEGIQNDDAPSSLQSESDHGYRFVILNEHGEEEDLGPPPVLPGYFRMLTLMAYYIFRYELRSHIDVMIVEVGMGGRYDATNFIDYYPYHVENVDGRHDEPERSLLQDTKSSKTTRFSPTIPTTPICVCGVTLLDYDHVRVLGDTLGKIAWEKGGIFTTTKLVDVPRKTSSNNDDDESVVPMITPRPTSSSSSSSSSSLSIGHFTKGGETENGDNQCLQHRRVFYILDSNPEEVMDVMKCCAQIEGQGGTLKTVDATGSNLRQALLRNKGLTLGLAGDHQYGNATLAVQLCYAVVNNMKHNSNLSFISNGSEEDYTLSVLKALSMAEWPARCQTYCPSHGDKFENYAFYLDGAHTPQSLEATVDWFYQKINSEQKKNDHRDDYAPDKPILVFNCSHERNPLELLELLSSTAKSFPNSNIRFDRVYFTKSDSVRPSAVTPPTATDLLSQHGIPIQEDVVTSTVTSTWQETLACLWRHVEQSPSDIRCNMNAKQVLEDLLSESRTEFRGTEPRRRIPVFVTGSLYLVGSFLDALGWAEESSPITKDGLNVESSNTSEVETSHVVDFFDVDDFNRPGADDTAKSATTHGTEDGRAAGEAASFLEGQMLGASKGLEIGIEIGFAQGLLEIAREHLAALAKVGTGESNNPTCISVSGTTPMHVRVQRSVDELEGAIKDFPTSTELFRQRDTLHDGDMGPSLGVDVREKLQRIRARCKVLTVQLGIPHHSLKRVMDDALSHDTSTKDGPTTQARETTVDTSTLKDISTSNDW